MHRPGRASILLGGIFVLVGVVIAALSKDWLENTFGIEPDAGNGFVELLLVLVPIAIGAAFVARGVRARQRGERPTGMTIRRQD
jgi:hypothetical protein